MMLQVQVSAAASWFAAGMFFFWAVLYGGANHQQKRLMILLLLPGAVGGVAIDLAHSQDFWQPEWWPIGSAVFGAVYLGIVTAWTVNLLELQRVTIRRQLVNTVSSHETYITLGAVVVICFIQWSVLGWNSVFAVANSLVLWTVAMLWQRPEARLVIVLWMGVLASLILFTSTVGLALFILWMTTDLDELAAQASNFYAVQGLRLTAVTLIYWACAFGAAFGTAHIWGRNLRLTR